MDQLHPGGRTTPSSLRYLLLSTAFILVGCASPGPPKAPSLHAPQPVRNLTATRIANTVQLHFTVPDESTDKLPLRGTITGQLCRQVAHNQCVALASSKATIAVDGTDGTRSEATWTDNLPPELTQNPPQLLTYRIEFFGPTNHTAGFSPPTFTASGPAPAPVDNLKAEGTRLGTLLSWTSTEIPGEILLYREELSPPGSQNKRKTTVSGHAASPTSVWLCAHRSTGAPNNRMLDSDVLPDVSYRYTAQRHFSLQLESHAIDSRSQLSAPITFILRRVYPPPAPTDLTAAGYVSGTPSVFAVDLVWQPTEDTGLLTPLAGYNIYRQSIDSDGKPISAPKQLNTSPVVSPAFHDASASASMRYRYSVSAIDTKGNESSAITTAIAPSAAN